MQKQQLKAQLEVKEERAQRDSSPGLEDTERRRDACRLERCTL